MTPVKVENLTNLERKLTISVEPEHIQSHINERVKKLMKTAKVNGFRPGKVPENVIKSQFGIQIQFEAIDEAVNHSLSNALKDQNLFPAGTPHVHFDEKYEPGKPFMFSATFEVFPEINIAPFSDLIIEKTQAEITETDIEKTLEGMQKQQTHYHEVNRAAKENDRVWIKFEGTVEGKPFDGGKADNMPLVLGSKSTIPGFEDGILNATVGQDLTVNVSFPENYGVKDLAGKPAQFLIHVNKIEEPHAPELNDAFAEKFDIKEGGIEKLREQVKETLQKQLAYQLRQRLKSEVMNKLAEAYKNIDIPKALVQRESEHLMEQMKKQFSQYTGGKSPNFTPELFADRAKTRVTLGLVLNEIIKRDQLKADASKVRQLIEEIAERFDDSDKIVRFYYQDQARLNEIENLAIEEQVVEKILSEATIVEKTATASEILNQQGV